MRYALLVALWLSGCSWDGTWGAPTPALHRMLEQPRYDPYEASAFFEDGMAMRLPPEGVVELGGPPSEAPPPLDRALLRRGQDRYEIFCAPCHGVDGYARTPIAADMTLRPPPSLQQPYVIAHSDEDLYRVVRDGFGLMPAYGSLLAPRDRWAVVAYLRALQLSQHVPVAWLSPGSRPAVRRAPP
ncbi:MAG TPA: cytochrome c [Sandaracinaceae bacterium]